MRLINYFLTFIIFQAGWIITIVYQDSSAAVVCLLLALLNFALTTENRSKIFFAGIVIASIGFSNDLLLAHNGVISFYEHDLFGMPFWLASLWLLFASTFHGCLAWLASSKLLVLAILGAVGGAISYGVAASFAAFSYNLPAVPEFLLHAANWFILFPLLFRLHLTIVGTKTKSKTKAKSKPKSKGK
jgi:hypothetical protein